MFIVKTIRLPYEFKISVLFNEKNPALSRTGYTNIYHSFAMSNEKHQDCTRKASHPLSSVII